MPKTIGVYAGSFDPLTNGHVWMVQRGRELFGELIIALGINPDKRSLFSVDERIDMIAASAGHFPHVKIDHFTNLYLVDYARKVGARFILRGIRSVADFEFERGMRQFNAKFDPDISTIFLMPPSELADVSSSVVKGFVDPDGWEDKVRDYVPPFVFQKLKEKHDERK